MEIISTIAALRLRLAAEGNIGFVPTMGNLHAGHIDLFRLARDKVGASGCVVASIFVNRLQFAPHEDFDTYPRTFKDDCDRCEAAGVNIVFAPIEGELYPVPQRYLVEPSDIQHVLDGAVRPGHFRGVATVVLKLFNIVRPHLAVFGKKDYQQCRVINDMVLQLNMPIALVFAETVRAGDGLALSSRNSYLSAVERAEAPRLISVLTSLKDKLQAGAADFGALEAAGMQLLESHGWRVDYLSIRRQQDLFAPHANDTKLVVLVAARLGSTRLIDNLEVTRAVTESQVR